MIAGLNNVLQITSLDRFVCLDIVIILFYVWWYYFATFLRRHYKPEIGTVTKIVFDFLDVFIPSSVVIFVLNSNSFITIALGIVSYIISATFYILFIIRSEIISNYTCGCDFENVEYHHTIEENPDIDLESTSKNTGIINLKTQN